MTSTTTALTQPQSWVIAPSRENMKLIAHLLCLIGFGALTALAKKSTLSLGIPGHSALLWLGTMMVGRNLFPSLGAGSLIGVSTAVWGIPLGLNHSFLYTLGLYGGCGLTLDLVAGLARLDPRTLQGAMVAGGAAHLVKFALILFSAMTSPVTRRFLFWGVAKSAALHLLFGVLAGLLAYVTATLISNIGNRLGSGNSSQQPGNQ